MHSKLSDILTINSTYERIKPLIHPIIWYFNCGFFAT